MLFSSVRLLRILTMMAVIFPAPLFAIRAEYLSAHFQDSADIAPIVRILENDIDPAMAEFPLITLPSAGRDSMVERLLTAYRTLNGLQNGSSPKITLLKCLVLLYLGRIDKPADFTQAITSLKAVARRFPECPELAWMRAMHLLCSGSILEGVRVFDSLRVSGFTEREFLGDYARSVFYTVVPQKNDTFSLRLIDPSRRRPSDTAVPASFTWTIIESNRAALPFYEYEATFAFRKRFSLVFSGLLSRPPRAGMLNYSSIEPLLATSLQLIRQLSDRLDSAHCVIHIDVNDVKISPYEYLVKRISGIYDSIESKSDLAAYGAISLRGYRRDFWGREGMITAYIVFDRTIADLYRLLFPTKKPKPRDLETKIRFTITMRCGMDVWDQAEAKLQSVIRAF